MKPGGEQDEVPSEAEQIQTSTEESLGRGQRTKQPSVRLRDYIIHIVQTLSPSIPTPTPRHPSGTAYPLAYFVNCDRFSM